MFSHLRLAAGLVAATSSLLSSPAHASPVEVRVQVQAPFLPGKSNASLTSIENASIMPFARSFSIPFTVLEKEINGELRKKLKRRNGVVKCTDPCPDVTWSIDFDPSFRFTKKDQPTITQVGESGESKVRVQLETIARLHVKATAKAETWMDSATVPIEAFVVVRLRAGVDVALWPEVKATKPGKLASGLELELELINSNIDIQAGGVAAELGLKWGSIIGFAIKGGAGAVVLGPLLAIIGKAAADAASAKMGEIFDARVSEAFATQTKGLEKLVNGYFDPKVKAVDALRAKLMDTTIPGANKSMAQLQSDFGVDLQLHTATVASTLHTAAVMRFSPDPAGGRVLGRVRMPKQVCEYATFSTSGMQGKIPLGLVDANTDLASKVGSSCAAAVQQKVSNKLYLGASPAIPNAQKLPTWTGHAGTVAYQGTISESADWYQCSFQISGLPKATIAEVAPGALSQRGVSDDARRLLMTTTPNGRSMLLDAQLQPVPVGVDGNAHVTIGGKGQCDAGSMTGGLTPSQLKALRDMLDPAKCPQCGIKRKPGASHIYEIGNWDAFVATPAGKAVADKVVKPSAKATPRAPSKGTATRR